MPGSLRHRSTSQRTPCEHRVLKCRLSRSHHQDAVRGASAPGHSAAPPLLPPREPQLPNAGQPAHRSFGTSAPGSAGTGPPQGDQGRDTASWGGWAPGTRWAPGDAGTQSAKGFLGEASSRGRPLCDRTRSQDAVSSGDGSETGRGFLGATGSGPTRALLGGLEPTAGKGFLGAGSRVGTGTQPPPRKLPGAAQAGQHRPGRPHRPPPAARSAPRARPAPGRGTASSAGAYVSSQRRAPPRRRPREAASAWPGPGAAHGAVPPRHGPGRRQHMAAAAAMSTPAARPGPP